MITHFSSTTQRNARSIFCRLLALLRCVVCRCVCVCVFFSNFFYNYVSIHSSICISAHINMEKRVYAICFDSMFKCARDTDRKRWIDIDQWMLLIYSQPLHPRLFDLMKWEKKKYHTTLKYLRCCNLTKFAFNLSFLMSTCFTWWLSMLWVCALCHAMSIASIFLTVWK